MTPGMLLADVKVPSDSSKLSGQSLTLSYPNLPSLSYRRPVKYISRPRSVGALVSLDCVGIKIKLTLELLDQKRFCDDLLRAINNQTC